MTKPIEMLTPQVWQEAYPKSDYPNSQRAKACTLQFLLANNHDFTLLEEFVNKIKDRSFHRLSVADAGFHNVTPLHVAVMKGNFLAVKLLVGIFKEKSKKEALNQQDDLGWTALHFARLTSEEIYNFLEEAGANAKTLTHAGALPEDLDLWVGKKLMQNSLSTTYLELPTGLKPLSELNSDEFFKLLGVKRIYDRPLYPPTEWKKLWEHSERPTETIDMEVSNLFLGCQDRFPKLVLRRAPELEKNSSRSFELVAGEDIAEKRVVAVISGMVKAKLDPVSVYENQFIKDQIYRFERIDAEEEGGVWRFANSGWPNLTVEFAKGANGSTVCFLLSTETIKKGTPLLWDYGPGTKVLNWGKYKLFGKDKMRAFFKQGLQTLLRGMEFNEPLFDNLSSRIIYGTRVERLVYPLNNPAAFLDLYGSDITTVDDWNQFVNSGYSFVKAWFKMYNFESNLLYSFVHRVEHFDRLIRQSPNLLRQAKKWILDSLGNLTVMQILKGMDLIVIRFAQNLLTANTWDSFKNDLNSKLSNYNWLEDEFAPIGPLRLHDGRLATLELNPALIPLLQDELKKLFEIGFKEDSEPVVGVYKLYRDLGIIPSLSKKLKETK